MKYENITEGRFLDRPNRFIAHVEIGGQIETVHVKNTGRCKELLWSQGRRSFWKRAATRRERQLTIWSASIKADA